MRPPVDAVHAGRAELLTSVDDDAERIRGLTQPLDPWRGRPLTDYPHRPWAQPQISRRSARATDAGLTAAMLNSHP